MASELPAGPDLDALVAERVTGHCWHPEAQRYQWRDYDDGGMWERQVTGCRRCQVDDIAKLPPPPYSTDMRYAWAVVEHLAERGHVLLVKIDGLRPLGRRYNVIHAERGAISGEYASAADAICRAALLLMEAST